MIHYESLGVEQTASHEQIKTAFRRITQTNHPDKPNGNVDLYRRAVEAWEVLGNPETRAAYDNGSYTKMSMADKVEGNAKQGLSNIIDAIIDQLDPETIPQVDIPEGVYAAIKHGEMEIEKKLDELRTLLKKLRMAYRRTMPKDSTFAVRLKQRRRDSIKLFKQVRVGLRIAHKMREYTDQFVYEFKLNPMPQASNFFDLNTYFVQMR